MLPGRVSIPLSMQSTSGVLLSLVSVLFGIAVSAPVMAASDASKNGTHLSAEQVVENLEGRDRERAQTLRHLESTRTYRLVYHGFPSDREGEMVVEATYDRPATKTFKIVSHSGSKLIMDRVFKRLLDSEKEALEPEVHQKTMLNRDNYDISMTGYEAAPDGGQYVLTVIPKSKSKYVYRGKVWVDATDFAVTRIDAEPAQNPSFWTRKNTIHHEYMKVGDFWVPRRNESDSDIRLGGHATLTIEYKNYRIIPNGKPGSGKSSAAGPR